jgi:hypothetical protein
MTRPADNPARVLSAVLAGLMALQAGIGLIAPGLYRDAEWAKAAWFGNDLVTLFVAVPLLAAALLPARRGSRRAELVWFAMLGYAVYNYAYYVLGARMNELFLLYVTLFVLPVVGLVLALGRYDVAALARGFSGRTPVRAVSGYMMLTGLGLAVAWTAQWAGWVFGGVEPAIGEEAFTLIAAMDLSLMVPYFVLGAVLLWRRHPWGYVLGAIMNVKGATYTLVLTASSTVAATRGIEGSAAQIPVWGLWTLAGAAAAIALVRGAGAGVERG